MLNLVRPGPREVVPVTDYDAIAVKRDMDDASDEELETAEAIMDRLNEESLSIDNIRQGTKKDAVGIMAGKCPECEGKLVQDVMTEASIVLGCAGTARASGCGYKAEVLLGEDDDDD